MNKLPATFLRGGTSKGLFILKDHLPPKQKWDSIFVSLIGSPDPYGQQINGMGCGSSSTSKIVLVNRSERPGFDVDYLFGQVEIKRPYVDYSGSCGNMVTGVGLYSILKGLVSQKKPNEKGFIDVRVWQANINKKIVVSVPCDENGVPYTSGNFELFGVPGKSAEIVTKFIDPGYDELSNIFPTGNSVDQIKLSGKFLGKSVMASLVNVGNPTIFVNAKDVGLKGDETALNSKQIAQLLESVRSHGSVAMGIGKTPQEVSQKLQTFPKISFVAPAENYSTSQNQIIEKDRFSLLGRIVSLGKIHHTFTATGLLSLGTCAAVPGSIPNQLLTNKSQKGNKFDVKVGHRAGITEIRSIVEQNPQGRWQAREAQVSSSARLLMDGYVYY